MKLIYITLFLVFCAIFSSAQVSKNNWMVGGAASFSSTKTKTSPSESTTTEIHLTGNVGYFVIDKLAVGLQPKLNISSFKSDTDPRNTGGYGSLGPFLRYYLLPAAAKTNLFVESSYSFGKVKLQNIRSYAYHEYTFSAGPEIFLTPSAGLQLSVGYVISKTRDNMYPQRSSLHTGLGFQYHF